MRICTITLTTMPTPVPPESPIASIIGGDDADADHEDDDHPEHLPAVAPHELAAAPERPQAAGGRSSTTTGAATDQIVIRISPGMMIRMKPIAIPIPATIPTRISWPITGVAAWSS